MSPNSPAALSLQNAFNKPVRHMNSNSYQAQRFPQGVVSLNGNAAMNGYSAPVRNNIPPQVMHEIISRSMTNAQQIPNQAQNIHHTQYVHPEPSLSSYWNLSPAQWMAQAENTYQNQSIQDFNQASPLLHRRMQPQIQPQQQIQPPQQQIQQQRPLDFGRQIQQAAIRFNPTPFSDNSQYIFPNAQNNQQHKDVLYP